jgi:hypothetical protein
MGVDFQLVINQVKSINAYETGLGGNSLRTAHKPINHSNVSAPAPSMEWGGHCLSRAQFSRSELFEHGAGFCFL